MSYTRREFGKLALAGLPAAAVLGHHESLFGAFAQAKPNSVFNGVQIGTITYSYRSMPDQSAEATLKYILDSGISAIELMGGPVESFAGAPTSGRGGGAGRGPGGPGGAPPDAAGGRRGRGPVDPANLPPGAKMGSWNGETCVIQPEGGRAGGGGRGPGGAGAPGGGGGRGRAEQTPEQQAAQQEAQAKLKAWRTSASMDKFKQLRKMYNDAGVSIYAWKQLNPNMSDEEFEYIFNVAEALGCTHTTLELPAGENAAAELKRIGDFAMKKKIYAAYHTHMQGSMTAFDQAFSLSKGNMANVDFGHWVAAGNVGGTPMQFLQKYHDRISSFHLKDRTTPEHCSLNLAWGTGETPIKDILQMVSKNKWKIPASIELEYQIPEGSDAVKETKKCVDYCRAALSGSSSNTANR
jgi:sugar phosphate isomerase/epimerase